MDTVREWWAIGVAVLGAVFWLARLEGRVNENSKELLRVEREMERDRAAANKSRTETNDMLKEMRADIKMLLGRGHVQHFSGKTIPPRDFER